jgi:hypothetical protein
MGKTASNARGKEGRKRMIEPSEKALKTWVLALTSVASLMVAPANNITYSCNRTKPAGDRTAWLGW